MMKVLRFFVCLLLWPVTIWYGIGVAVRNLLYDCGWLQSYRPPVPTLCVGNLCLGGSGKTPHTEYLLRRLTRGESLEEFGIDLPVVHRVALLSRGYGRKSKGFVLADAAHCSASELGDEPAMMARKFPEVITAVCERRSEGIRRLLTMAEPPDLIVLDDAYQHRAVQASHNILLTEYQRPYFRDWVLPFGNLREGRMGRRRADTVVVTKCPASLSDAERENYRRRLRLREGQRLVFSQINYVQPCGLFDRKPTSLAEYDKALLFTGIAHPEPLQEYLSQRLQVSTLRFGDHHDYSVDDMALIKKQYAAMPPGRCAIITTEKDAARLWWNTAGEELKGLPVYYWEIAIQILPQ